MYWIEIAFCVTCTCLKKWRKWASMLNGSVIAFLVAASNKASFVVRYVVWKLYINKYILLINSTKISSCKTYIAIWLFILIKMFCIMVDLDLWNISNLTTFDGWFDICISCKLQMMHVECILEFWMQTYPPQMFQINLSCQLINIISTFLHIHKM